MIERPYQRLVVKHDGARATVTLSNPARKNAIGPVMVNELLWALEDALVPIMAGLVHATGWMDAP